MRFLHDCLVWPEHEGLRCEECGEGYYRLKGGFAHRAHENGHEEFINYTGPQCNHCDHRWGGKEEQQAAAWELWDASHPKYEVGDAFEGKVANEHGL